MSEPVEQVKSAEEHLENAEELLNSSDDYTDMEALIQLRRALLEINPAAEELRERLEIDI